ncbi:hypothetical protein BDZ90DRAFT_257404 [Jaminaea rosea]|uniref:Uncharacterized protein n=1 Tax=Jaminaea rosea TaxID=1569628 RepID=A0A316UYM7_9BASI|nr:hypothetical protein BDZ90DRAFT_257404 [Jaminaea rosea]PWN30322.1 hypothetical protein BDZ90DRAFT_257404 [Jaminaea rosea]
MARAAAPVRPLDAAEQDTVLRSRLSHSLAHRPLNGLRNRIASILTASSSLEQFQDDRLPSSPSSLPFPLLCEAQGYLAQMHRTHLASTCTSSAQLEAYAIQLKEVQHEEQLCKQRIEGLKRELQGVRRRRREKVEFGRVVEGIEAWFKPQGTAEIEDSLSTLLSHMTASFLYQAPTAETDAAAAAAASPHTCTLSTLHAKLETMLTLSREIREIVGWKPGTGMVPPAAAAATSSSATNVAADGDEESSAGASSDLRDPSSSSSRSRLATLNPTARPFRPSSSADSTSGLSSPPVQQSNASKRRVAASAAIPANSSPLTSSDALGLDDEGEEGAIPSTPPATKRRRVQGQVESAAAVQEEEEEEGSIAPTTAPSAAATTASASAARPARSSAAASSGPSGGGRATLTGRPPPSRAALSRSGLGSGGGARRGGRR